MTRLIVVISAAAVFAGCPQGGDPDVTCGETPQTATLESNVQALLSPKCAPCHTSGYSYGDYTAAERSAEVVGKKTAMPVPTGSTLKMVDPGKLESSTMWLKVLGGTPRGHRGPDGEGVGGVMPQSGTLTEEEKLLLKDWICTGAK